MPIVAASAFYKFFDQPIERVVIAGAQPIATFQNADTARRIIRETVKELAQLDACFARAAALNSTRRVQPIGGKDGFATSVLREYLRAVLFDVDFTLVRPGPELGGEEGRSLCGARVIVLCQRLLTHGRSK